jgi:hypothetical protein
VFVRADFSDIVSLTTARKYLGRQMVEVINTIGKKPIDKYFNKSIIKEEI